MVHGGSLHSRPVRIDAGVLAALEGLAALAPLHQPHNLAPIRSLLSLRPDLPQVACFDTTLHAAMPDVARRSILCAALSVAIALTLGACGAESRHARKLGAKEYWNQYKPSPEFVILFLPNEALFSTALQLDPKLIENAWGEKVIIATPVTGLVIEKIR